MKVIKKIELTAEEEKAILTLRDMSIKFAEKYCRGTCGESCPFYWMCEYNDRDNNAMLESFNQHLINLM